MSRDPLKEGWRYYGCARWGCDAVNPDYQSYGTSDGRSWCLHHRPGWLMRRLMGTNFPVPRSERQGKAMLPISLVRRHYVLTQRTTGGMALSCAPGGLEAPDAE